MNKYPYKSSHIDYFQIGAHIGNSKNDPIYFKEIENKTLILVEPVPFLYSILKHNYSARLRTNEIEFLQIAVSDKDGKIELYTPSKDNNFSEYPYWLNQVASTTDKYIKVFEFRQRWPKFKFEKIEVECRRFNTIVKEREIKTIDTLIMDTEGHDFTILMDIDFNLVKPRKIIFENFYMKELAKIGEDGSKYKKVMEHLTKLGYKVVEETDEDTTVELV